MLRSALLVTILCFASFASSSSPRTHSKGLSFKASVDSGVMAYLSDNSAWEIRPENRQKVASWPIGARVLVYRTNDSGYPFRLVLKPSNGPDDIVAAKMLERIR
jgi:hypothetical protein